MDFTSKLQLYKLAEEVEFGLFNLDGIGDFLYINDIPKNEKHYQYLSDKDKGIDLIKWLIHYVKKVNINMNTYLVEYTNILISLIEDSKSERNRYFLSLIDRTIPKSLIDLSLKKLGVKEILKDPENSRIWIINFYPYTDSNKHSVVWNYIEQSENVLREGVEKVLINITTKEDTTPLPKRLNMIVNLILNKRNTIIEEEEIKKEDSEDTIKIIERGILDKFTSSTYIGDTNENSFKLFTAEERKEFENSGFKDRFYFIKYNKGNIELIYNKLSIKGDILFVDKISKDIIKFNSIEDLFLSILETRVEKGIIKELLTDTDKVNLKTVLEKLYLNINIPYDKLEKGENNE